MAAHEEDFSTPAENPAETASELTPAVTPEEESAQLEPAVSGAQASESSQQGEADPGKLPEESGNEGEPEEPEEPEELEEASHSALASELAGILAESERAEREAAFRGDPYLEDDELLLGDDTLLHESDTAAAVKQQEGVVAWELLHLYNEQGRLRNRLALRTDPPILKISEADGSSVQFMMTRELSSTLARVFGDLQKGYAGVDPRSRGRFLSKRGPGERWGDITEWVIEHKVTATVVGVLLLLVIGSMLFTH